METNIGLTPEQISTVEGILEKTLANQHVLLTKTKQFHRNVVGVHFTPLHELFDTFGDQLKTHIDETAERIRMLGKITPGTMKEFLNLAILVEQPTKKLASIDMLHILLKDYENFIRDIRKEVDACSDAHDEGNADFLIGLMKDYEKNAWMLRSTIEEVE